MNQTQGNNLKEKKPKESWAIPFLGPQDKSPPISFLRSENAFCSLIKIQFQKIKTKKTCLVT